MAENTKQQVRDFYDRIGWSQVGDGLYQNARYEDLRPAAQEYIHQCHLRVNRYLDPRGDLFLDAGSGPVQWPEYLTYSENYRYRVCADLSLTALKEARQRLGDKGLYVVMDIARLPFKPEVFDGIVSLHTIHHLPPQDHQTAYAELVRVLKPGHRAVVVNGWSNPPLMRAADRLANLFRRLFPRKAGLAPLEQATLPETSSKTAKTEEPVGTFVHKSNAGWLREQLKDVTPIDIYCWRSVSTKFTRAYVNDKTGGRLLRFIFWLEELFPRFFGENGQYPIVAIKKTGHQEHEGARY